MRKSFQTGQYSNRSRMLVSRSSLQQPKQTFFGLDEERENQLKEFLFQPIDSRAPFEDVQDVKVVHKFQMRLNEPSPEIENEWDLRLQRIKCRKEQENAVMAIYPSLPRREEIKEINTSNPLNVNQVEDVQDINNTRVYGPMNKTSATYLPPHRFISDYFLKGKSNLKKRRV